MPPKSKEEKRKYYTDKRREYRRKNLESLRRYQAAYHKRTYQANKERLQEQVREYDRTHKDERREYMRRYGLKRNPRITSEERRELTNKRKRDRRKTDARFVLCGRMSARINGALKYGKCGKSWKDMIPYTLDDLVERLKQTLPDGYSWDDFLNKDGRSLDGLHIDHILPVSKFNFEKPEDDDFQRCWALSNLRLLPAKQNMAKHNKIDKPLQTSLIFN